MSYVFLTKENECLTSLGIGALAVKASTKMDTKVFMIPFKENALTLAEVMFYGCTA